MKLTCLFFATPLFLGHRVQQSQSCVIRDPFQCSAPEDRETIIFEATRTNCVGKGPGTEFPFECDGGLYGEAIWDYPQYTVYKCCPPGTTDPGSAGCDDSKCDRNTGGPKCIVDLALKDPSCYDDFVVLDTPTENLSQLGDYYSYSCCGGDGMFSDDDKKNPSFDEDLFPDLDSGAVSVPFIASAFVGSVAALASVVLSIDLL